MSYSDSLDVHEQRLADGQELLPAIAASLFAMSEVDDMAQYRERIDAVLARNKELEGTPLTAGQEPLYRTARAAGYDERDARNIARRPR